MRSAARLPQHWATPQANRVEATGAVQLPKRALQLPQRPTDEWYNLYYSMHSELQIPMPRPPTKYGIEQRVIGSEASYVTSYQVLPGHTAVLMCNPHAGNVNVVGWNGTTIDFNPVVQADDFFIVDYATALTSQPNFGGVSNAPGKLTLNWCGTINDCNDSRTTPNIFTSVPPVGGADPRVLLQPNSPNAGYELLGGSMRVEATTKLNGSAVIYAADMNQNVRLWGDSCIVTTGDVKPISEPPTASGTVYGAGGLWMNVAGTVRNYCPPNTQNYSVASWQPTLNTFFNSYRKKVIGGNDRVSAYAQIPGDNDFVPSSGVITETQSQSSTMIAEYPGANSNTLAICNEFNLFNLDNIALSSKCLIAVQNTGGGSDNVVMNVVCTAAFACPVESGVPEYTMAKPTPPHHVECMDFLATADVGSDPQEAYLAVKKRMVDSILQREGLDSRRAATVADRIPVSNPITSTGVKPMPGMDYMDKLWAILEQAKPLAKGVAAMAPLLRALF